MACNYGTYSYLLPEKNAFDFIKRPLMQEVESSGGQGGGKYGD